MTAVRTGACGGSKVRGQIYAGMVEGGNECPPSCSSGLPIVRDRMMTGD